MINAVAVATVPTPLGDAPFVRDRWLVERGDTEVGVRDLRSGLETRFPAPWPRDFGTLTLSPDGDVVLFSGVHALRAVDATGAVRWELRHGCWSAAECAQNHTSYSEYADDHDHRHADKGSAAYAADGSTLWAHIRNHPDDEAQEEWLVLDPADGAVLARYATDTVGSSFHTPPPDPAYMGLTVGEGDEESPAFWGHWDGRHLSVVRLDEEVLLAVSPDGDRLLATDPGQWSLYLRRTADATELGRLAADDAVRSVDGDRVRWDYDGAFPFDDTAIVGTEAESPEPRHWLIDPATMSVRDQVAYPVPIAGPPRPAGAGQWLTSTPDGTEIQLWTLT
ncbi:hypothetical protein AB0M47_04535 [Hamadaea sp. NPDC051192]|uniref:hypothetical protein n=1 Tax=Hamadaea sp. NPDC051192 TaxID=3154940 RepID=UPI0034464007